MKIFRGDALEVLIALPDNYVDCCVTSPPYYNQRDFGVAGQIGREDTPEEYVERLTDIFREVRRVLKPDGTLWLNTSDSYAGNSIGSRTKAFGIKPKDMIGIPWMLALSLRNDGWYLRSDIIWNKTNAMPSPVRDRPVSSYEHIFLLSKSPKYYYDLDALKELSADGSATMRRGRDVWNLSKNNAQNPHYSAYPVGLAERCILAGCKSDGVVLDPFAGSGTTGIAALRNGRDCLMIELNPRYCDFAEKRIMQAMNKDTAKENGS